MEKYAINATALNIRPTPSTEREPIGSFLKGEIVELINNSPDGKWSEVKKKNKKGWVSNRYLSNVLPEEFAWMTIAADEIGVMEIAGSGDEPRIVEYLNTTPDDTTANERRNDETAWCSAFVNWCLIRTGFTGTNKSAADSWLNWGKAAAVPRRGCIAVFRRDGGNHVAFYIGESENEIEVLGGNQSDAVNIGKRRRSDLLGYRVPKDSPVVNNAASNESSGDTVEKIKKIAADSPCASYFWKERSKAPIGYIKGMALVYAESYRELKTSPSNAVKISCQPIGNANVDALAHYGINANTEVERLRAVYTLALGLGMRESSGNTTEGRDESVPIENATAANAEAGLFQVSYDSFGVSNEFQTLFSWYKANPNKCFLNVFKEGIKDRNKPLVGSGKGAEFQKFTKECPAFATRYVMIMLRKNRRHFGPLKLKEAEYRADVEKMFKDIETVVDAEIN